MGDLPTPRELELETLLRQRDTQVSELGVRLLSLQSLRCSVLTLGY